MQYAIGITPSYEFYRDGNGTWSRHVIDGRIQEIPITWSVSDGRLEIYFADQPTSTIYYFEFLDDTTLALRRPEWSPENAMTFLRVD